MASTFKSSCPPDLGISGERRPHFASTPPAPQETAREMAVIEAQGLTKVYNTGDLVVEAVRGVDLQVKAAEYVALVGPSGSGKSTLLNMLGGMEPPSGGRVLLDGVDLATLTDTERTLVRRRRLGFIFQAFNLLPILTAEENVALPLRLDGLSGKEALERAVAMLDFVGVAARRKHLPSMLSGGEQQRVAVARALVIRPALLLADEPTGNLDSANGQQISRLLRDLVSQKGQSVVIVTHDPKLAAQADRILSISDGLISSTETNIETAGAYAASQERDRR